VLCDEKDRRNEDSERDDQGRCPDAAAPWGEVLRVVRSGHRKVATVRLGWLEQRRPQAELSRRICPAGGNSIRRVDAAAVMFGIPPRDWCSRSTSVGIISRMVPRVAIVPRVTIAPIAAVALKAFVARIAVVATVPARRP